MPTETDPTFSTRANARARRRRLAGVVVTTVLVGVVGLAGGLRAASAQVFGEHVVRFDSVVQVDLDGTLHVTETILYDFGANARHGIYRLIPDRFDLPDDVDHERATPIDKVSVSSPDAPSQTKISHEGRVTQVRIGDPDRTITGRHTYVISYRLRGAINRFDSHDELYLNITGNDWDVPIGDATARVLLPAPAIDAACFAGAEGSSRPCDEARAEGTTATYAAANLAPSAGLTIVAAVGPGTITPAPTPILVEADNPLRAFRLDGLNLAALVVGAIGIGLQLRWLARRGRDRRWQGGPVSEALGPGPGDEGLGTEMVPWLADDEIPVQFEPPDGIRPGLAGTLVDEVANPVDVTATIVDLAVRGHLTIEELPRSGMFGKDDWRLTELAPPDDELLAYEELLKQSLFEGGDTDSLGRSTVLLSDLKNEFSARLRKVQDALYDETMTRGWFDSRPDQARNEFVVAGVVVLIFAALIVFGALKLQRLGLAALPVAIAGVVLLASSPRMPRRTPTGRGAYVRTLGFVRLMAESEQHRARFAEDMGVFSEYLPYAVAFGQTDRWARTFEVLAAEQAAAGVTVNTWYPAWYLSTRPFAAGSLASSLSDFSERSAGIMTSTPAGSGSSGFGGGGFSGGGFGGGGGGSW